MSKFLQKISFFDLKSNIRKTFFFRLTTRRNFFPILNIYFLTFPNAEVRQIWVFTAIGTIMWFLLEIPSGYVADRIWHRNSLILAKLSFILSTVSFLIGGSFLFFAIGSVFLSIAISFISGTQEAFMHETLDGLWRVKEYTKINSRISGNVSLLSVLIIVSLPFLITISYRAPFWIALWFDIVWLLVALSLVVPKKSLVALDAPKSIFKVIRELKKKNFVVVALYLGVLWAMIVSSTTFREPYLQSIGYPVVFIGFVMWASRLVWFFVSRITHLIENKIKIKNLIIIETIFYVFSFVGIALIKNPFIVWWIFSLLLGYRHGRRSIFSHQIIKILPDKKYKATALSVVSQWRELVRTMMLVFFGYIMDLYSFQVGFVIMAGILLISLGSIVLIGRRSIKG